MKPIFQNFAFVLPLLLLCASTAAYAQNRGVSFDHGDWNVTCDNTLTCRMEGWAEARGAVLITRAAGSNAPVSGEVTLPNDYCYDNKSNGELCGNMPPPPSLLTLWINGTNKGRLTSSGEGGIYYYSLTQSQVLALLAAARSDKDIEFRGGEKPFILSGNGISAVMLKMDEVQGRIGTPGALIRKGNKPEESVFAPIPKPIIRAAKVSDEPSRELTQAEVQKIEPLLWKSMRESGNEKCALHTSEKEDELEQESKQEEESGNAGRPSFFLTSLDKQNVLISTQCAMGAYQGSDAFWLVDRVLKNARFLMAGVNLDYSRGVISGSGKGRGIGDCFGGRSWVWDGTDFRLSSEWYTGRCTLIHPGGTWDSVPIYVTEVIPSE